ncbi:MAG: L,D-transpeptidase, partial [Anaerolineales bacterium]|nr:L,D-transpeptidase [Anaerolineales bacterium]
HGQYWHDGLGYKRSHGCVNLSPLDARWLYNWAARGTYVWVYDPSLSAEARAEVGTVEGP